MFLKVCCSAVLLALSMSSVATAQGTPAQVRPVSGQVGFGFSFAKPDYGGTYFKGFSAYGDVDLHERFGVEADVHFNNVFTPTDIGENTFMLGPRVALVHQDFGGRKNFMTLYAKALGGAAQFQHQKGYYSSTYSDTYGAFALGGGIDLRVSDHLSVRPVDIEYQRWPGFSTHGLTPIVPTFGAAYRF